MKYNVKFSCGHTEEIELFGKVRDREERIKYFEERGVCSACYREMKRIEEEVRAEKEGLVKKEMPYREYKLHHSDCKTVRGSYDGIKKTIVVYVKKDPEV